MRIGYTCNGGWGGKEDVSHLELVRKDGSIIQLTVSDDLIELNGFYLYPKQIGVNAVEIQITQTVRNAR